MSIVANLLDSKGHDVLTVKPETTVLDAIKKIEEKLIGTALVMENGQVVGILSERDVIRRGLLKNRDLSQTLVSEIMTTQLISVLPETSLDECMQLITENHIRHLPVLCNGSLCGIVSIGDVVKYLIVEKEFKIKNLETYINTIQ